MPKFKCPPQPAFAVFKANKQLAVYSNSEAACAYRDGAAGRTYKSWSAFEIVDGVEILPDASLGVDADYFPRFFVADNVRKAIDTLIASGHFDVARNLLWSENLALTWSQVERAFQDSFVPLPEPKPATLGTLLAGPLRPVHDLFSFSRYRDENDVEVVELEGTWADMRVSCEFPVDRLYDLHEFARNEQIVDGIKLIRQLGKIGLGEAKGVFDANFTRRPARLAA